MMFVYTLKTYALFRTNIFFKTASCLTPTKAKILLWGFFMLPKKEIIVVLNNFYVYLIYFFYPIFIKIIVIFSK